MHAPRTFVTALASAALMLSLAGCEKPTPAVTLQSGGEVTRFEATNFCHDDKVLTQGTECPGTESEVTLLSVHPGEKVTVDVDKKIAETGWFLFDLDAKRRYNYNDKPFWSFVADFTDRPTAGVMNFELYQVDRIPETNTETPKITGRWKFQLVQK